MNNLRDEDYKCVNTAYHADPCCDTCWNKHPLAYNGKQGQMFLGTNRQRDIAKECYIERAIKSGFSRTQAIFLFEQL